MAISTAHRSIDLGRELFSFAVIADTHLNPKDGHSFAPYLVNAKANARYRHVVYELNQRDISFVIHLGDVLHPMPDNDPQQLKRFEQAAERYRAITSDLEVPIHIIPGNHDVGDMPIKTGHTMMASPATRRTWESAFGKRFASFEKDGVQFILLDAQVLNCGDADEAEQWAWLEDTLAASDQRRMMFIHHPLFLVTPDEGGHYDIIDQPARGRLLKLLGENRVEAVFTGHTHNFWYNRIGDSHLYLAPSTTFVRQDYSEMFRVGSGEPLENGRDDAAKLGYFLVTAYEHGHVTQFCRTFGKQRGEDKKTLAHPSKLAPDQRVGPRALIGFDLRQDWAEVTDIAPCGSIYEFDRRQARNDYPLLALLEMGVQKLRIPLSDLTREPGTQRIKMLHDLGLRFTLMVLDLPEDPDQLLIAGHRHLLQRVEIASEWNAFVSAAPSWQSFREKTGLPIYFDPIRSWAPMSTGGAHFHYVHHGFPFDDTAALVRAKALKVDGVCFRIGTSEPVFEKLKIIARNCRDVGIASSVQLRCAADDPSQEMDHMPLMRRRICEAMIGARIYPDLDMFLDTLGDTDRGFFPRRGVIDRRGNPNSAAHLIRSLHHFFAQLSGPITEMVEVSGENGRIDFAVSVGDTCYRLKLVESGQALVAENLDGQCIQRYEINPCET